MKLTPRQDLKHVVSSSELSSWALTQITDSFAVSDSNGVATIGFPRSVMPELTTFISMIEQEGMLSWSIECTSLEQVFLKVSGGIEAELSTSSCSKQELMTLSAYMESLPGEEIQEKKLTKSDDFVWHEMTPWRIFSSQMIKYGLLMYRDLVMNVLYICIVLYTDYGLLPAKGNFPVSALLFLLFLKLPRIAGLVGLEIHEDLKILQERQNVSKPLYWTSIYAASFLLSTAFSIFAFVMTFVLSQGLGWWICIVIPFASHATVCTAFFVAAFFKNAIFNGLVIAYLPSALLPDRPWSSLFPVKGIFQASNLYIAGEGDPLLHLGLSIFGSFIFGLVGICWIESTYIKSLFRKSRSVYQSKGESKEVGTDFVNVQVEKRDPRVEQEAQEVHCLDAKGTFAENESLRLVDLKRSYGAKNAISGISLRILKGETFSMLGPNGMQMNLT